MLEDKAFFTSNNSCDRTIPACTAKNISNNLSQYTVISTLAGSLACILGVIAYAILEIPAGPLIIIASALLFLLSIFKRNYSAAENYRNITLR